MNNKKPVANNVDIAIKELEKLQKSFYNPDSTPNSLMEESKSVMQAMKLASQEIMTNYADISRKLTEQMNTGRVQ